eukprot:Skav213233  [mRNA]  locus=scaffold1151:68510:71331:+ [translate_table: standard]
MFFPNLRNSNIYLSTNVYACPHTCKQYDRRIFASSLVQQFNLIWKFCFAGYGAWPHQVEAFQRAQAENIILNLPTGTGKTLVACMLLDLFQAPGYVSVFVVNSRALVSQQAEYLRTHSLKQLVVGDLGPPHPDVTSAQSLGLPEMARLEQHLEGALAMAAVGAQGNQNSYMAGDGHGGCHGSDFGNWEFQKILESEKPRLRGVLEALGPAGWYGFMWLMLSKACHALPEVMMAKLQSKLSIMEDDVVKSNLLNAIAMVRPFQLALMQVDSVKALQRLEVEQVEQHITGKCQALLTLLQQLLAENMENCDKILVFVERVSVACCMARLISSRLGVLALHVAGVQGMDGPIRQSNLASFRDETQVLVATSSLEEGLDVPSCRYVIRYDSFSSAKSHVQGAGRARHADAQVYYFENDPLKEEENREFLESIARGEKAKEASQAKVLGAVSDVANTVEAEAKVGAVPASQPKVKKEVPGVGAGHRWGVESTMWDYQQNKSFRGMSCACGARLKITSRAYGQGRKKKERSFTVEGPHGCPTFSDALDDRFHGVDPSTGILR